MSKIEEIIRKRALARLAKIFAIPVGLLKKSSKFGEDLEASGVSDFRYNEFDRVDHDIHDVADKNILAELSNGHLVIRTVTDYCDHMVRCYESKPNEVTKILGILEK